MNEKTKLSDRSWYQLVNLFVPILLPIAVVYFGSQLSKSIKQKEIDQKYLELAISILKTPQKDHENTIIRQWALNVFDSCSPVKLSPFARIELLKSPLNKGIWTTDSTFDVVAMCDDGYCWSNDSGKCVKCFQEKSK